MNGDEYDHDNNVIKYRNYILEIDGKRQDKRVVIWKFSKQQR